MLPKKRKPEEIIGNLREVEIMPSRDGETAESCRRIAVSAQTYYLLRKDLSGLKTDFGGYLIAMAVTLSGSYLVALGPKNGCPA